jgi:hypothetical protein
MVLMGDEVRRTQRGNNNAYCQDNEISWFDWTLLERHRDLHRFVKTLGGQRLVLGDTLGVEGMGLNELLREADIQLHGIRLNAPDLSSVSHSLAVTVRGTGRAPLFHVMFNAYWEPLISSFRAWAPTGAGDDGSTRIEMRRMTSMTTSDPRWRMRATPCTHARSWCSSPCAETGRRAPVDPTVERRRNMTMAPRGSGSGLRNRRGAPARACPGARARDLRR